MNIAGSPDRIKQRVLRLAERGPITMAGVSGQLCISTVTTEIAIKRLAQDKLLVAGSMARMKWYITGSRWHRWDF